MYTYDRYYEKSSPKPFGRSKLNEPRYEKTGFFAYAKTKTQNEDTGLTLTYFMARSNLIFYAFTLGKLFMGKTYCK